MLFVGQTLHWFPHGDPGQEPWTALVTKVNAHSLRLHVLSPSNKDGIVKDGVRHMSDPTVHNEETKLQGGWDHTPQTKLLVNYFGPELKGLVSGLKPARSPDTKAARSA
jgi:hypothetical protein